MFTNDPANASVFVTLKGDVVGSVILRPARTLSLRKRARSSSPARVLVRKEPGESGELIVSGLRASSSWLATTARKVDTPEPARDGIPAALPGDWIVEASLAEGHPWGVFREELRFRTGLPREPEVTVPVTVSIHSPLIIRPGELVLSRPAAGSSADGMVLVVVRPAWAADSLHAEASPPDTFRVSLERTGERHYRATVSWDGSGEGAVREGRLTFRLSGERFDVPLRVE